MNFRDMTNAPLPIMPGQLIHRDYLIALLETALGLNSNRFARTLALYWLAYFPGDLPVNLLYAKALIQNNQLDQAISVLKKICQIDPEYIEAQRILGWVSRGVSLSEYQKTKINLYVLGDTKLTEKWIPEWAPHLQLARLSLAQGDLQTAESLIHKTLLAGGLSLLTAITHLQICMKANFPAVTLSKIAKTYHQRYPESVAIDLILADALLHCGKFDEAISLIHKSAARDVTSQVAKRLWGECYPYKNLWPSRLEAPLELQIPAEVGAILGYNKLPSGKTTSSENLLTEEETKHSSSYTRGESIAHKTTRVVQNQQYEIEVVSQPLIDSHHTSCENSESGSTHINEQLISSPALSTSLRSVQEAFEWVANRVRKLHLAKADGRFPVYVIFTTRYGLERQYSSSAIAIEKEMRNLANSVKTSGRWDAMVLFADDSKCMNAIGLKPAKPDDPWALKLVLADLDKVLSKRGEMIGAVLIVGGPEVVPFHRLPNPVDDADEDVASDNPYATKDENYLIPEWPVGRLPGGCQEDPQPLLSALREMSLYHIRDNQVQSWYRHYWEQVRVWLHLKFSRMRPSWGYTAAIWRRASLSVFRPIGQPNDMLVSPPVQVNGTPGKTISSGSLPIARLGYFNLHGLPDASEWYGQRDPTEQPGQPDYPIALRPQDIPNNGRAPKIVFTEACYGANIQGKTCEDALALKFLTSGTKAFVGSTCISYGSICPPLVSADLLGNIFWRYLQEGLVAGEALRRAKIQVAREMMQRQGYLDGEDQKTLISFVLYGDPLAQAEYLRSSGKIYRSRIRDPRIKTVCDRAIPDSSNASLDFLSPEIIAQIKQWVAQYLPGMVDAEVIFSQERLYCHGENHKCPTSQLGGVDFGESINKRKVVTLSKQVTIKSHLAKGERDFSEKIKASSPTSHTHYHFVRITLDEKGKIVKTAMSR